MLHEVLWHYCNFIKPFKVAYNNLDINASKWFTFDINVIRSQKLQFNFWAIWWEINVLVLSGTNNKSFQYLHLSTRFWEAISAWGNFFNHSHMKISVTIITPLFGLFSIIDIFKRISLNIFILIYAYKWYFILPFIFNKYFTHNI